MHPTENLKDKVALNLVVTKAKLMAAGPLLHADGCLPSRVVLIDRGYEFSVHTEVFDTARSEDVSEACKNSEASTIEGYYYKPEEFDKAIAKFANRVVYHASNRPYCTFIETPA